MYYALHIGSKMECVMNSKTRIACDVVVVGAGIVGIATAARLAQCGRKVMILERDVLRSDQAVMCAATLGDPLREANSVVRGLACASAELLAAVPGALRDKEVIHLFGVDRLPCCVDMYACCVNAGVRVAALEQDSLCASHPYLRADRDRCAMALRVPAKAIDARTLYRHYHRQLRACGVEIRYGDALQSGCFHGGGWTVATATCEIRASVVVNCAGVDADQVARRCGARRLDLMTLRRSCIELSLAPDCAMPADASPLICWEGDAIDLFCDLKPDGRVLLSCLDSERQRMCDSEPDCERVGTAIVCFEERTDLRLDAGSGGARTCRQSFAADCRPAIGWSRETPAFFWCSAMGDFGTACAAAAAAMASDMIQNRSEFSALLDRCGVSKDCLCPDRLGFVGIAS